MVDQSQQRFRRASERLGGAAITLKIHLTAAFCLLSLCSGCHLGDHKPSAIEFLKPDNSLLNHRVTKPVAAQPGLDLLATKRGQKSSVTEANDLKAEDNASAQTSNAAEISLVSYAQDNDSSSRRLEFEPQLDEADELDLLNKMDEAEAETELSEPEADVDDDDDDNEDAESVESDDINSEDNPLLQPSTSLNTNGIEIPLDVVLQSTLDFYPEIEVVLEELQIAAGAQLQASGSFDTKVKIDSENTPVGFYETFRNKFSVEQPTFNGGSVFGGYRFGRGDFATWYLERNTNAGGEINLGANWKFLRDRQIDARRVALWQSQIQRNAVEPMVQQQLLQVFRDAEIAYWNWVASGQVYQRNLRLFQVAKNRVDGIEKRIQAGDLAEITRTDNDRSILAREVKLIKAKAKLDQAAIKLSLYYRDIDGTPIIATDSQLPQFDSAEYQVASNVDVLVTDAICCRPETKLLALDIQAIGIDLAKAQNDLLPQFNAQVKLSNDFGRPTSASPAASSSTQSLFVFFDEKDEFQVDVGVYLSQSLQLRKARGKIQSLKGKKRQLKVKRQFLEQKIAAEVQQNYQLTVAAKDQVRAAKQNYALAQKLSDAARQLIEVGDVDIFEIILREQQELDAAIELAASQFAFFSNRANLNASVGCERYQSYGPFLQVP